jgi:hypothetical protein
LLSISRCLISNTPVSTRVHAVFQVFWFKYNYLLNSPGWSTLHSWRNCSKILFHIFMMRLNTCGERSWSMVMQLGNLFPYLLLANFHAWVHVIGVRQQGIHMGSICVLEYHDKFKDYNIMCLIWHLIDNDLFTIY